MIAAPDVPDVYLVPEALQAEGLDTLVCEKLGLDAPAADLGEWARAHRAEPRAPRGGRDRARRQVHEAARRVPLGARGAQARGRPRTAGACACAGSTPRTCRTRRRRASSSRSTGCSSRAASARAAGRGRSSPARSRASARSRTSASASACMSPSPSSRGTSCGLDGANSTEMDPETPYPVIDLLPEQKEIEDLGGTMRLGAQAVELVDGTRAREAYGEPVIHERHRTATRSTTSCGSSSSTRGLVISGTFQEGRLVEIVELPDHPWFVASQFHPEFKSRPTRPAPLFREFVGGRARAFALAARRTRGRFLSVARPATARRRRDHPLAETKSYSFAKAHPVRSSWSLQGRASSRTRNWSGGARARGSSRRLDCEWRSGVLGWRTCARSTSSRCRSKLIGGRPRE